MPPPVFLSYARKTSATAARALHDALGADVCFLDTDDLEAGAEFPRRLTEALLASRVFVAFVDETYFNQWYCLREWLLARAPLDELIRRGDNQSSATTPVEHMSIGLGAGADDRAMAHLPPALRHTNWPRSTHTGALASLVHARLSSVSTTLLARCDAAGVPMDRRAAMVDQAAMPLPQNLAGIPLYPRQIPQSLGPRFVGRVNDIWRVHAELSEPRLGSLQLAALTGALQGGGGFGKTQLAREYLHRFGRTSYPGGCFWIDAGGGDPLERQFHGVLRALRPDTPPIEDMRRAGRDIRAELADALHADAATSSILFVVDNVPEPTTTEPPLPLDTWCPGLGKVTCLVTSRKRIDSDGSIEPIEVGVLDSDPAVALLSKGVPDEGHLSAEQWADIAEWVGCLPMVLTLLHAALLKGVTSPADLLATSRSKRVTPVLDAHLEALRGSVPEGALRGVTQAFTLSYDSLPDEAQRLARRVAWLAPISIPTALLTALSSEANGAAARAALIDRSFLLEARAAGGRATGRQMHRVLCDFLRTRSDDTALELLSAISAVQAALVALDLDVPADRATGIALVEHAAECARGLADNSSARRGEPSDEPWRLLVGVASFLEDLGNRSEEKSALATAVLMYRASFEYVARDRAPVDWAASQNNLGNALLRLGKRQEGTTQLEEAVVACEAALEVRTRQSAPTDWATTQNNLGNALQSLGERQPGTKHLEDAVGAYRAALEVRTRKGTPLDWAITQNNLGTALQSLGKREPGTTRLEEAVVAFRAALEVRTRDGKPLAWAMTQNNLGNALMRLGEREPGPARLKEAVAAFRAALEVHTQDRAPMDWATAQNNLGNVLRMLGEREEGTTRLDEAAAACRAALEVFERGKAAYFASVARQSLASVEAALAERFKKR